MNLSDKPCYPIFNQHGYCSHLENNDALTGAKGLTFRERLIIALASNPAWVTEMSGVYTSSDDFRDTVVKEIMLVADAIIKEVGNEYNI